MSKHRGQEPNFNTLKTATKLSVHCTCVSGEWQAAHDNSVNSLSFVVTSAFHQYFTSLGRHKQGLMYTVNLHAQIHTLLLNLSILQNTIIIALQAGCICEVLKTSLSTSLKWNFNIHFLKLFLMPSAVPFLTRAYKDVSSTLATFIPHEMEN